MHAHGVFSSGFSPNRDDDFEIRTVIGQAHDGGADPGEVLAAIDGVSPRDRDGWHAAWLGLGDRLAADAAAADSAGHRISAASAFLRSANAYAVALNALAALPRTDHLIETFRLHRRSWEGFLRLGTATVIPVEVPYEGRTLSGVLLRPDESTAPRATIVMVNGSDGSQSSLWGTGVAAGLRRGYAVFVFDGPGQQAELFERNVPFRPDWEAVLTPVYDTLAARDDVDAARIAVIGISQGGYWVPRALAFEHRFAAAVVDPGVVDVSTSWTGHIPKRLLASLQKGDTAAFDRDMALGMRFDHDAGRTWAFRARPYGTTGYAETVLEVQRYTVADVADRITTPLLITSPEDEQFWPGQSARLAALVGDAATVAPFTAAEGASGHCEPLGRAVVESRVFDWLDTRLTHG